MEALQRRVQQLEAELERSARRFDLLLNVTRSVSIDLDDLLGQVIHDLGTVLPAADVRVIYLHDKQSACLCPRACYGYDEDSLSRIRLQPGESMSGRVFQSGTSVLTRTSWR